MVFVLHRLSLQTGGLTKAWLRRIRLYAGAGWDVHLALISPDRQLSNTLRVLRAQGQLPPSVEVHRFWRSPRGALNVVTRAVLRRSPLQVPAWLDRVASPDGALIFADTPAVYPYLAKMRNPHLARVFVVHLAHLSAAATKLATPTEIANGPLTDRFASLSDETLRAADRIIVLTEAQKQDFQLRWGTDLPVEVIPHCADPVDPPVTTSYDPRRVVVLGRITRTKRWDDPIRAMARVIKKVPDAKLVIYGRGDDLERLQGLVEELGLTGSVTFAGYTDNPLQAMASAACVISTTRREAMPLTLLECLSVGTPVVVYDIRYGPREIVRDGVDGFVLPVHDVRGAANRVVRLLTEPELRDRMSRDALAVTTRFSREEHDRTWLDLGRDLYQRRG